MHEVRLDDVVVDGSTVRYEFDATGRMRQFFWANDFVADYGFPVEAIPESVLTIPWIANVCSIAWANGAAIRVPVVDERFLRALEDLKRSYERVYPEFMRGGEVLSREIERPGPASDGGGDAGPDRGEDADSDREADAGSDREADAGMLFSGGVDSLATYLRHRDERPLLIGINGFDVRLRREDAWAKKAALLQSFAESEDLDVAFVAANIIPIHNMWMVRSHFERYIDGNWFASVQAGIGLLGLAAPIAYERNVTDLHMASSLSAAYCGAIRDSFEPELLDGLGWAGTTVHLDGYELTRQDKIELIADHARDRKRASGEPAFEIHTCLESGVGNCDDCEKCARTAVGLLLAGLDPNELGYEVDRRRLAAYARRFESGEWKLDDLVSTFWTELQRRVLTEDGGVVEGDRDFFDWLVSADFDDLVEDAGTDLPTAVARGVARNTPYQVYNSVLGAWRPFRERVVSAE